MKTHIARPLKNGDAGTVALAHVIQAIDLTTRPEYRSLWRARNAASSGTGSATGLPHGGHASPMGFWLAGGADPSAAPADGLRITVRAPSDAPASAPEPSATQTFGTGSRPPQTVRLKAVNSGEGDLFLTVSPAAAQVVASEAAWRTHAESVLLAVCQYWRFCAVDVQIDRLTELAHGDIDPATMPGPAALRARQRLTENARAVRELLVDLPHFEGPLTDPLAFCTSERSAQVFESLVEKLQLEEWCEAIDERTEAIEDTYEAVTEKLFEYRNFAWEALLETIIVVILIAELGVMIWDALT